MNKVQLYQILSVLLLPYRDRDFLYREKDVIANLQYCFADMKDRFRMSATEYFNVERKYYNAERELMDFLSRHTEWRIRNLDDLKLLINMYFPEAKAQKCIAQASQNKDYKYALDRIYIDNLYSIAISLLTYRDGKVAIRTWTNDEDGDLFNYPNVFDKVQVWNLLGRMITVDVIIVAFIVALGHYDLMNLEGQTSNIFLADKTLEKILEKGLAETHLHFNAGAEFTFLWQEKMNIARWNKQVYEGNTSFGENDKDYIYVILSVYRLIWAAYIETENYKKGFFGFVELAFKEKAMELSSILHGLEEGKTYESNMAARGEMLHYLLVKWSIWDNVEDDILLATVYKNIEKYNTHTEMIFLLRSMIYFRTEHGNDEERHIFLQYIRYKNIYYGGFAQSNQVEGLANFSLGFSRMSKEFVSLEKKSVRYGIIFKSLLQNTHLKKLEVRISPQIKIYADTQLYKQSVVRREIKSMYLEEIKTMLLSYRNYMLDLIGCSADDIEKKLYTATGNANYALPTLGIIFHFHKVEYADNRIADTCWLQQVDQIDSKSKHIRVCRNALVEYAKLLEELRSDIPLLSEYVVGIDVASQENKAEPWVFAPLYTSIRNRHITKPVLKDQSGNVQKINNIGFTYHVGEEFRHLLSGLRHIDEVVEHFHYKAGDRLGHAIALGTDVCEWVAENEVVIIPVMEYMENLLWLWGKSVYCNWQMDTNMEQLEGKILSLAKRVYGDITGMTVLMLYEAYNDKFKLAYEDKFKRMRKCIVYSEEAGQTASEYDIEHFCKFYDIRQPYGVHWTSDKIFCTYFCPLYYQRYMEPKMVYVGEEDGKLLAKIQNWLIKKIESIGIYIEVNPTSNISVGGAKNFYSHHILKLNSKGLEEDMKDSHEVLLTVNSDDPIIFNTNSENELSYIYHALSYQGYNKERVLNWIDKVRQMGIDSSFVKKEKEPLQQYREISRLIRNIEEALDNTELKVLS